MKQRDVRQLSLQIFGIAFVVLWMVQYGVDVVEDIPFGYFRAIFGLELRERPIGDVFATVGAVFAVCIIGETLSCFKC